MEPTHRQIDYWSRCGALGIQHKNPGSGVPRKWTDHERAKLRALGELSASVHALVGNHLSHTMIAHLWTALDEADTATVSNERVTLTAAIHTTTTKTTTRSEVMKGWPKGKFEAECENCHEIFMAERSTARFCGATCRSVANRTKHAQLLGLPGPPEGVVDDGRAPF